MVLQRLCDVAGVGVGVAGVLLLVLGHVFPEPISKEIHIVQVQIKNSIMIYREERNKEGGKVAAECRGD